MSEPAVMPCGRAAVFSAVCVGLGAAGHSMASGGPVSVWACAIGLALVFALARAAAVRQRGLASIAFLMLGCQAGLHMLFDAVPGAAPSAMGGMGGIGGIGGIGGMSPVARDGPVGSVMPAAHVASHMGAGMLAGHVVAALVVSWWLRRGEAMVFALVGRLAFLAVALCRALLPPVDTAASVAVAAMPSPLAEPPVPAVALIRFAVVRRGPPLVGVVV